MEHRILVGAGVDLIGPDQSQYGMELGLVAEELGARQAIITTTRDNARVLRIADRRGRWKRARAVDLIAVGVDPLADPAALAEPANVTLVVQGGIICKDLRRSPARSTGPPGSSPGSRRSRRCATGGGSLTRWSSTTRRSS